MKTGSVVSEFTPNTHRDTIYIYIYIYILFVYLYSTITLDSLLKQFQPAMTTYDLLTGKEYCGGMTQLAHLGTEWEEATSKIISMNTTLEGVVVASLV